MKIKITIILLFIIGLVPALADNTAERGSLQGRITDRIDGEPLIGVSVYFPDMKRGCLTDENGYYRMPNLPLVKTTVQVSYIGHQTIIQTVDLRTVSELDFVLNESNAQMDEVVVTALSGNSLSAKTPSPISFISRTDMLRQSSTNIIDAIAKQPGISQVTTGAGISKPVIRGLGYNRVVVVNDGIRQEGQQWGDEHGIEIDAQSINSVEILKGPASLMYGSDAMAGVINMIDAPILGEGQIKANLYSEYQTNNGLINYSLNTAGNQKGYIWNVRYGDKLAHSYKNKYDGYVYNSGFKEQAFSGLVGMNKVWGYSHLTLSYYHLQPGIVSGERDAVTGKFLKPVFDGTHQTEVEATHHDFKSYGRQIPYQEIDHYKAVLDNRFILGKGSLKTILGYQQNQRREFEEAEHPHNESLYFKLHTMNYDVRYSLPELDGYTITTGVNGMYQSSLNKGHETLLPEYNIFDAGLFAIASKDFGKLNVSGGARIDYRHQHVKEFEPHTHDHGHGGGGGGHHHHEAFPAFTKNLKGISASLGLTYELGKQWNTKLNISRGYRAPNISELSSFGSHGGTVRYEIGNRNLKAENSLQVDWGISYSSDMLSADVALFANRVNNYIFSRKVLDDNGNDSIMDGKRVYQYHAGDAMLVGGEVSVDFHPIEEIHFLNTFSYVNSRQLHQPDSTRYLPMTPAPRWTSTLRYDILKHGNTFRNMYVSVGMECNFRQNRIYSAYNTETETPAYVLFNAGFGTDIRIKGKTFASVFLTADNLFDRAYQNHLSRLKYTDENAATGRTGVYNMGRNFGVKLLVPLDF